jgi:hypothetical protein
MKRQKDCHSGHYLLMRLMSEVKVSKIVGFDHRVCGDGDAGACDRGRERHGPQSHLCLGT